MYWINLQPTTAIQAFSAQTQSIARIKKEMGDLMINAFLTLALTELVESFNIGKTMNQQQIVFTVEAIKTDYYFLKPEELKYCFNNAKKGKYGVMYDRIDCAVICDWIEKYLEERLSLVFEKQIEDQKKGIASGEEVLGFLSEQRILKPSDLLKIAIEPKPPILKDRERTPQEIIVQGIFTEFDTEWSKIPVEPPGTKKAFRMIEYTFLKDKKQITKQVSQEEFLQIRLEEMKLI